MAARKGKGRGKERAKRRPPARPADRPPAEPEPPPADRRDRRPVIYAALDFVFALLYLVVFAVVIPNRHGWAQGVLYLLPVAALAMGGGMLARGRWGWRVSVAGCGALLLLAVVLLVLVLVSASFLAGVYGAFGRAASMMALITAALIVEMIALLPAFQLKYLMTRAGRRRFGREPS